jgi:hypothetical protein
MAEFTAEEKAKQLAEEVDFEKRNEAFGAALKELSEKFQIGLIVRQQLTNVTGNGNTLLFDEIKPHIGTVNLKKAQEVLEAQKTNGKKKGK